MERNEIKQNELVLSDEEEKIHKPRMDRRLWLNCNTSKWPINIKKNAICPLKISIDKDLQQVKGLHYNYNNHEEFYLDSDQARKKLWMQMGLDIYL